MNIKGLNLLVILLMLFGLQSCNENPDGSFSLQPNNLDLTPPAGPELYQKGWTEGCESGSNAYTSPFYKMIKAFNYKYDTSLRNNKMYSQVWKDAFIYCSIYWERVNSQGI
ncbi:MAG TPA: hypothetical protein DIV86_05735 [Alphaproteobacteria bacterium]|nr:hypothetical protein [Alphaproteobacteria bacterium]